MIELILALLILSFCLIGFGVIIKFIFDNIDPLYDFKKYILNVFQNIKNKKRYKIIDKYFTDHKLNIDNICNMFKEKKYTYEYLMELKKSNFESFLKIIKFYLIYRMFNYYKILKCFNAKHFDKKELDVLCDTFIFKKYFINRIRIEKHPNFNLYNINYGVQKIGKKYYSIIDTIHSEISFDIKDYEGDKNICSSIDAFVKSEMEYYNELKDEYKSYKKIFSDFKF